MGRNLAAGNAVCSKSKGGLSRSSTEWVRREVWASCSVQESAPEYWWRDDGCLSSARAFSLLYEGVTGAPGSPESSGSQWLPPRFSPFQNEHPLKGQGGPRRAPTRVGSGHLGPTTIFSLTLTFRANQL